MNKEILTKEEKKEFLASFNEKLNKHIKSKEQLLYGSSPLNSILFECIEALLSKKMGEQELEDKQMFWHVLMRISTLKPEYIYEEVDEYIAMCQDDINKLSKLN